MMISEKRKILNLPHIPGTDVIVDPNGRHVAGPDAVLTVGEIGQGSAPASDEDKPKKKPPAKDEDKPKE